ncbi:hypothetical protein [Pseudomonas sp. NPDC090201]|uniref:hypothetical protein n=1 Tax=Pseudomonas sp. NPDC090201 TaxID=3364475 RepID=UPI0038204BBD
MISTKVVDYCKQQGWWFDDASADYEMELKRIGIDPLSDFGQFYLHAEDGPTFMSQGKEIYQICWFSKNTNFDLALKRTHETLGLPDNYIPLDSFEGESGFFYDKNSGHVVELSLGSAITNFLNGRLSPQWRNFNDFLEFYFKVP